MNKYHHYTSTHENHDQISFCKTEECDELERGFATLDDALNEIISNLRKLTEALWNRYDHTAVNNRKINDDNGCDR